MQLIVRHNLKFTGKHNNYTKNKMKKINIIIVAFLLSLVSAPLVLAQQSLIFPRNNQLRPVVNTWGYAASGTSAFETSSIQQLTGFLYGVSGRVVATGTPGGSTGTSTDGSGTANQVALWGDSNILFGDTGISFASGTDILTVTNVSSTGMNVSDFLTVGETLASSKIYTDQIFNKVGTQISIIEPTGTTSGNVAIKVYPGVSSLSKAPLIIPNAANFSLGLSGIGTGFVEIQGNGLKTNSIREYTAGYGVRFPTDFTTTGLIYASSSGQMSQLASGTTAYVLTASDTYPFAWWAAATSGSGFTSSASTTGTNFTFSTTTNTLTIQFPSFLTGITNTTTAATVWGLTNAVGYHTATSATALDLGLSDCAYRGSCCTGSGFTSFATSAAGTNWSMASTSNSLTLNLPVAGSASSGLLLSTDWNTFNGKSDLDGFATTTSGGGFTFSSTSNTLTIKFPSFLDPIVSTSTGATAFGLQNIAYHSATSSLWSDLGITNSIVSHTATSAQAVDLTLGDCAYRGTCGTGSAVTTSSVAYSIEFPIVGEDDVIMSFDTAATLVKAIAVNKTSGDTFTWNLCSAASRQQATTTCDRMAFTSYNVTTATTTPSSYTPATTTIAAGDVMRLVGTSASSSQFNVTIWFTLN